MWNRQELKEKAKMAFKANYWKTVAVSVLLLIVGGGAGLYTISNNNSSSSEATAQLSGLSQGEMIAVILAVLGGIAAVGTIMFVIKLTR